MGMWLQFLMAMVVGSFVELSLNLAEFASKSLHSYLDLNFKALGNKNPSDEEVVAALNKAFDEVVQNFTNSRNKPSEKCLFKHTN